MSIFPRTAFRASGGYLLLLCLFISPHASADTITLKNGKALKGLVVERHADRIFVSTVRGEIPILISGIQKIDYDDPAQNYLSAGKEFEEKNRLGEALSYYEKAAELNPALEEARQRAQSVRNRFWTRSTAKPLDEIAKRQALYDLWESKNVSLPAGEDAAKSGKQKQSQELREGIGIALEKRGDWIVVADCLPRKDAWLSGLRRKDRLVSLDGNSLRFLKLEAAQRMLLEPSHTPCQLDYEREIFLTGDTDPGKLGLHLVLGDQGLEIERVDEESAGASAGFSEQDLVTAINGEPTRYMPLNKAKKLMKDSANKKLALTVRRSAILTRK